VVRYHLAVGSSGAVDWPGSGDSLRAPAAGAHPYREIAMWWLASRALVVAAAFLAAHLDWPHPFAGTGLDLLARRDGTWYRLVAERAYFLAPDIRKGRTSPLPVLAMQLTSTRRWAPPDPAAAG
jgi:hypothetical protein